MKYIQAEISRKESRSVKILMKSYKNSKKRMKHAALAVGSKAKKKNKKCSKGMLISFRIIADLRHFFRTNWLKCNRESI